MISLPAEPSLHQPRTEIPSYHAMHAMPLPGYIYPNASIGIFSEPLAFLGSDVLNQALMNMTLEPSSFGTPH
jgi:hypothetical protein